MSVEKHLANARKFYSQSRFADAIYEYRLALEQDPQNEEAADGLRSLTEGPSAGSDYEPDDRASGKIKTNFLAHQAQETSVPITKQPPVRVLLALIGIGLLYGLYQLVMYYVNYDKIVAVKYVEVHLQKPVQKEGVAYANVQIVNYNPLAVKDLTFKYEISSEAGSKLASGNVTIPTAVPAGDSRTFADVKLAPVAGEARKMHADLADLNVAAKPSMSADLQNKFIEACAMKTEDSLSAFTEFVKAAPEFAPGYIKLAEALQANNDFDRAVKAYEKAIKVDPEDANAHYHLGVAYFYKADREAARKELTEAARLAPDDPVIASSLKQLGEPAKAGGAKTGEPKAGSAKSGGGSGQ